MPQFMPDDNTNPWLRLLNLFNPMGGNDNPFVMNATPNAPSPVDFGVPAPNFSSLPQQPNDEEAFVNQRLASLYNPQNEMQDRLSELMGQIPERNDPSTMRKIFAAISGMGAEDPLGAAERFAYAPYYREMEDFQKQFEPISRAADLERQGNVNQRIFAEQSIQRELEARRATETERRNRELAESRNRQLDLQEQRNAVYAFKAANPNYRFERGQDGFLYAVNPQNPTETIKTNIEHNQVSPIELASLNSQYRMEQIRETGAQSRETVRERAAEQRETEAVRPRFTAAGTSQLEISRARVNRAQQAKIEHPEWSPFIGLGPSNTVIITPPGRRGPTAEMYNQIKAYMIGVEGNNVGPVKAGGNVDMIAPDGRELSVPPDKVEEMLRAGAKRKQ
jgi:hypothetical protein